LQSGVIREINPTFNRQHVVCYPHIDAIFANSGHFEDDSEGLIGLEYIGDGSAPANTSDAEKTK
jgi:hypothetical protein